MPFNKKEYLFITGLISALRNRLLTAKQLQQLEECQTLENINRVLQNSYYVSYLSDFSFSKSSEQVFFELSTQRLLNDLYKLVKEFSSCKELPDIFLIKYQALDLRNFIKKEILKSEKNFPQVDGFIKDFFKSDEQSQKQESLEIEALLDEAIYTYSKEKSIEVVDQLIDQYYYKRYLICAKKLSSPLMLKYYQFEIDHYNLLKVLSFKKQKKIFLVDGGNILLKDFEHVLGKDLGELCSLLIGADYQRIADLVRQEIFQLEELESLCIKMKSDIIKESEFYIWGAEPLWGYAMQVEQQFRSIKRAVISLKYQVIKERQNG
jgi:vacuolar-type H+-ATPase subunit C/Vma6